MLGGTKEANQALKQLGDAVDGTKADLSGWGGESAEAFNALHGKARADIDAQRVQADALFNKLTHLYPAMRKVLNDYEAFKDQIRSEGMMITPPGIVQIVNNSSERAEYIREDAQEALRAILVRASAVDEDIAEAIYDACGEPEPDHTTPAPSSVPQPAPARDVSGKVPGPDGDPPYGNGATPTMIPGAKNIALADNPPGYNGPAGPQRDQAWKDDLNNADHSRKVGDAPAVLPKPEAVQDKSLRVIGAATRRVLRVGW